MMWKFSFMMWKYLLGCGNMGQIRSPTPSSSSTAPSSRCWSSMMTSLLQVIFSPNLFFFLVLLVVWGFRSRKRKMWISENFRPKWLPLKCVLKAIDRGQEAIEWTGFFGSRSIRDPFSRCEIHFVNSVLQLSPFSQQLALYSQRTPLLADSQCIHSLFLIWISFAKDCQLVTLTHSHSLFLLLHQWWVTENMECLFKSNQIIAWIKNKCFKRWRISFWCFILKHCNVERLPLLNCESSI